MLFAPKRPRISLGLHWRSFALYGGLFGLLALALYWRLGSLLPGYSAAEGAAFHHSEDLSQLMDNPFNAPFLLVLRALLYLDPGNLLWTRLTATIFGLVLLGLFCWLVRQWHDDKTAIIGTLLFGLSAWFLHTARMGTPDILLSGVFVLTACGFWLKHSNSWLVLLLCFLLAALYLYVPGMVWFIAAGIVWQWKTIDQLFKKHLFAVSLGALLLLAVLAPLGWAIHHHTNLLTAWLGLPPALPSSIDILKNIAAVPYHLVIANSPQPATWLGRAPLLDVFSATMLVMGAYVYLRHVRLLRTPLFITLLLVSIALTGISGAMYLSALMPFLYVVIAAGVGYLIDQWLTVFPRNPIAKTWGAVLITLVVGLVCLYHLDHYFIGWPQAQATHDIYVLHKP